MFRLIKPKRYKLSFDFSRSLDSYYLSKMPHVVWREVKGKGVLLNTKSGLYYAVAKTSLLIWQYIDKGVVLSDLICKLSDGYRKDIKIVERDVLEILDSMQNESIIDIKLKEEI